MKENNDGFVRADQIDLKSLDEQLERHLNRVWTMDNSKTKKTNDDEDGQQEPLQNDIKKSNSNNSLNLGFSNPTPITVPKFNQRHDWEIDPAKLLIKSVIARGTFGTVHRGVYDGQDVAGLLFHFTIFVLI